VTVPLVPLLLLHQVLVLTAQQEALLNQLVVQHVPHALQVQLLIRPLLHHVMLAQWVTLQLRLGLKLVMHAQEDHSLMLQELRLVTNALLGQPSLMRVRLDVMYVLRALIKIRKDRRIAQAVLELLTP